jgi:Na+-transporting methylmalonyl-CoA/oxaloacetate decarboxylase gamma subunit
MEEFREALSIAVRGVGVVFLGLGTLILTLMALGRLLSRREVEPEHALVLPDAAAWTAEPGESLDSPMALSDLPETGVEEMVAVAAALAAAWQSDEGSAYAREPVAPEASPSPWRVQGRQRFTATQGTQRRSWRR